MIDYKKINEIHTPDTWIEETLNQTKKMEQPKNSYISVFKRPVDKFIVAAILIICFALGSIGTHFILNENEMTVTAYAYETNEKISSAGAVISTGTISDTGEMSGLPLMFYLSGKNIKTVRFSCKNQQLIFRDWTEKRISYGPAQNFTVDYGKDENEYYYLTIDWEPNNTIRKLTDDPNSTIASLPTAMKEDIIVMEITFFNGKTVTKAITISLQDNGQFFASFNDYQIRNTDNFIKRPDNIQQEETSGKNEESNTLENIQNRIPAAEEAAREYYSHTAFELVSLKIHKQRENKIIYWARVKVNGIIQDPDRTITLKYAYGKWNVVNEGY